MGFGSWRFKSSHPHSHFRGHLPPNCPQTTETMTTSPPPRPTPDPQWLAEFEFLTRHPGGFDRGFFLQSIIQMGALYTFCLNCAEASLA